MKPILVSCYFKGHGPAGDLYERMARVLEYTAYVQCCDWDIRMSRLEPPEITEGVHSHVSNSHKLDHWNRAIQEAPDGARVLLIDGDTMIVRPIDDVWSQDFDVAYTTKRHKLPFNGGVMFFRVSDRTRSLCTEWLRVNMDFLAQPKSHQRWRQKYGGINQAAFGYLLDRMPEFGINLIELPCSEWNCEQSSWHKFDPNVTRIVHIKSNLRKAVFGRGIQPGTEEIVKLWRSLERQVMAVNA